MTAEDLQMKREHGRIKRQIRDKTPEGQAERDQDHDRKRRGYKYLKDMGWPCMLAARHARFGAQVLDLKFAVQGMAEFVEEEGIAT